VAAKGEAAEESRKLQLELLKERRTQAELAEQIAATNKVQRERATFAPRIAGMTIAEWADLSVEKGVSVADVMRIWGVPEHEIPSFDTGGVVPGPIGAPRLVLA